ncbi:unnamed protein product [Coffea canephora]|uniref:Uncharacterized protein n=1 Tax=Coffea canephora TaxID=49390 RepID=A0A068U3W8_COFCA|nr:unnamed protein product [Coffea canephora]
MEMLRTCFVMITIALVFSLLLPSANAAQVPAPAPSPSSDGVSVDQGIAYVLMLVALAVTYIFH